MHYLIELRCLRGILSVARQANILSFNEVKALGALHSRRFSHEDHDAISSRRVDSSSNRTRTSSLRSGATTSSLSGGISERSVAKRIQDNQRIARASHGSPYASNTVRSSSAGSVSSRSSREASWYDVSFEVDSKAPSARSASTSASASVASRSSRTARHASGSPLVAGRERASHTAYEVSSSPIHGATNRSAREQSTSQGGQERESAQRMKKESLAQKARKRFRSAKAEKAFERTIGAHDRATSQPETSRPAMYEMRMGSTHRKSANMQNGDKARQSGQRSFSLASVMALPRSVSRVLAVAVVTIFAVVLLYPSCASYYQEVRQLQQLQAEYDALQTYNAEMQASIDYLNTDEGIEDYARSELGWIRDDEQTADVEGVEVTASQDSDALYAVAEGSVAAPDTWYSSVLDVVFGYKG